MAEVRWCVPYAFFSITNCLAYFIHFKLWHFLPNVESEITFKSKLDSSPLSGGYSFSMSPLMLLPHVLQPVASLTKKANAHQHHVRVLRWNLAIGNAIKLCINLLIRSLKVFLGEQSRA